jgi:hypothetical protein
MSTPTTKQLLEAIAANRQEVQAATLLLGNAQARLDALVEQLSLTLGHQAPQTPDASVEELLNRAFDRGVPLTFGDEPQV